MAGWYAAPVAKRAWADAQKKFPGVYFLGYVGDLNHQGSYSGHNPGRWAEANRYPQYGAYDGRAVLAVDIGVPDAGTGYALLNGIKNDSRVLYTIYRAKGYRPAWRGGSTFGSSGHMTHVHISFTARAANDTRPFFGASGGGAAAGGGKVLNISGLEIPNMDKDELGRWLKEQHALTQKHVDDKITGLSWGIVAALEKLKKEILEELDE